MPNTVRLHRVLATKPEKVYRAFIEPDAMAKWLPPNGFTAGPVRQREQAETIFEDPCRFQRWPQIPIHVIASADDRFFPLEFQRGVARARVDMNVEVVPGGHLVALSHPEKLAEVLLRYEREV